MPKRIIIDYGSSYYIYDTSVSTPVLRKSGRFVIAPLGSGQTELYSSNLDNHGLFYATDLSLSPIVFYFID